MWLWIVLLLGVLCNEVTAAPRRNKYLCPPDYVRHGQSCYFFSAHMATWFDAHFDCKDKNSELAKLEKGWEDRYMRSYLNKPELARLERWIGGIYNWETKRWVWGANGGQPLKYQGFSRRSRKDDPRWNCIIMDPTMFYKWSSRGCIQEKHYICETPLKKLKPPRPSATKPRRPPRVRPNRPRNRDRAAERNEQSQNNERTVPLDHNTRIRAPLHGERTRKRTTIRREDYHNKERTPTRNKENRKRNRAEVHNDNIYDREGAAAQAEPNRHRERTAGSEERKILRDHVALYDEETLYRDPELTGNKWSHHRGRSTTEDKMYHTVY